MKKWFLILTLLLAAALLTACGCEHVWTDADCDTAKTCSECGATEGAPLGHSWLAATCETAKTCEVCGKTEGSALGHSWTEADCENARTCASCKLTEGEALGHVWMDATTETPKTCATCAATEGERIITDERFTTTACAPLFGTWAGRVSVDGAAMGMPELEGTILCDLELVFNHDGTAQMTILYDKESYIEMMTPFTIQIIYDTYAEMGYSKAETDAVILDSFGMSVEEYVATSFEALTSEELTFEQEVFYYADGNTLYMDYEWLEEMDASGYTLEGDTLTISEDTYPEDMVLTRVK